MPECIVCGAYTKFNGGLCTKCYYNKNEANWEEDFYYPDDYSDDESYGLSDRERKYHFGMIKGRIAETLIQELFLRLDYKVFRYGMENTIPGAMELLKWVRSDVRRYIRQMPALLI